MRRRGCPPRTRTASPAPCAPPSPLVDVRAERASTSQSGGRVPESLQPALRLLPLLLSPEGGEVEEAVAAADETVVATGVGGVGVEHVVPDAQEAAEAGTLHRLVSVDVAAGAGRPVLLGGAVVVLDRRDRLVERDVEVVVEVAVLRGVPREAPTPLRPVGIDLG